jgi:hypothetical protein
MEPRSLTPVGSKRAVRKSQYLLRRIEDLQGFPLDQSCSFYVDDWFHESEDKAKLSRDDVLGPSHYYAISL